MKKARYLDVDDLFILYLLGEGMPVGRIADKLNVTQPAISLRLAKMRGVFGEFYERKKMSSLHLTAQGKTLAEIARVCVDALSVI